MRVLIVSSLYAGPDSRGKLRALASQGVELLAAIPGGAAGLDGGVRLAPIPVSGDAADPESLRWSGRGLRRAISDFRPDLVHIEEPPGGQPAAAAARAAIHMRVPYTVFSAESLPRRRGLLEARRFRAAIRQSAGVIGANRVAEALLLAEAPDLPAAVVPQQGVTPGPLLEHETRPGGLGIGFVGRLVPERGGEMLLRACSQLLGSWTLTVVGTGPEQEPLEALAQRLGLASRIRWLGGIPATELSRVLPDMDCLVCPSRDSGSWVERGPAVLLDAMSRGIVPIVTQAGALPELVGDAGIVVTETEALALALQELIAEPARLNTLGRHARQRILDQYVETAIARRLVDFWQKALAHAETRRLHLNEAR